MYGDTALATVLEQCAKLKTQHLDVWPRRHGTQREQLDELGKAKVIQMLEKHEVEISSITRFDLGAFGLRDEFKVARSYEAGLVVTGAGGPKGLTGQESKRAIQAFAEKLKPELDIASAESVTLTLENHSNTLLCEPDSIRWLMESLEGYNYGIELAPYHLPQDPHLIASIIKELGDKLKIFCAWQYGNGCMKPMPKDEELAQMPGVGKLDFGPMVAAMREMRYQGYVMVFMHATPRGIPIMPTVDETTQQIQLAMHYLNRQLASKNSN